MRWMRPRRGVMDVRVRVRVLMASEEETQLEILVPRPLWPDHRGHTVNLHNRTLLFLHATLILLRDPNNGSAGDNAPPLRLSCSRAGRVEGEGGKELRDRQSLFEGRRWVFRRRPPIVWTDISFRHRVRVCLIDMHRVTSWTRLRYVRCA